jgi:hypothetical protein
MVVAMSLVVMVQVTTDQIIDMIAVRNGFMTAARAVTMRAVVVVALVRRRARRRVRPVY